MTKKISLLLLDRKLARQRLYPWDRGMACLTFVGHWLLAEAYRLDRQTTHVHEEIWCVGVHNQ
mgnify:CR=1 FL=1